MPGIAIPALASITEHAMDGYNDTPWDQMIAELRDGPPLWSPYRIGPVDDYANGGEFFVHHEDVRRGEPGWAPRAPDATRDEQLWALMRRGGPAALPAAARWASCCAARQARSRW